MLEETDREALEALRSGDERRIGSLLNAYQPRLQRMVALRLDPRLAGRLAPSDVLQETFVDVARRIEGYAAEPTMPFSTQPRKLRAPVPPGNTTTRPAGLLLPAFLSRGGIT